MPGTISVHFQSHMWCLSWDAEGWELLPGVSTCELSMWHRLSHNMAALEQLTSNMASHGFNSEYSSETKQKLLGLL